ncbi:ADP-ribosylglycohydrolase family protein [Phycicoccus sp. MAQZ13P-2]|uniref:ADP-ribosylglycohydrolase family protein n=1 Tax=Phycicoccus mangrovi TaxID=2840470 RepID=UPI001C000EA2|nr:ADP-ribosylglycohydrolase family protein [Phycicoccus mangrovi]MBT9255416.1 ADP-ribosylglycohydrolase family protein [Phycicoccus mangrovi]MBT9273554.1 ADP-ribosylglycohydrolase family protein [Phycicoccus mangrovi]
MVTAEEDAGRLDHAVGALLGVHAGDSLGAAVEFSSREEIRARYPDGLWDIVGGGPFDWPAGHATDDTDLTRAVLLAHLDRPDDVVRAAADHMLDWFEGRWPGRTPGIPPRDVGGATRTGLTRYRASGDPRRAGSGPGQAGNGSLMRCLPTALAERDAARRVRLAVEISAVTHDDPRCTAACAAYVEVAAALVEGAGAADAVAAGLATAQGLGVGEVVEAFADDRRPTVADLVEGRERLAGDGGGYVLDSLRIALVAVLDPRPLEPVLVDVVRMGRDTDSNAAIAGGLLGARDGAAAVPARWVGLLQFADEFADGARELWVDRRG